MNARILSQVVCRSFTLATLTITSTVLCSTSNAQSGAGFYTDPSTGIVYRKVARTVERPVVETKVESQEQTVYRPETVRETKPEMRTVYTPVVEHQWQPRVHGRWNPFQQPTVAYHHVPQTRWEARSEVVNRTETKTQWVPEKRTVEVPRQLVRMQREEKVDYEVVGRVAPQSQEAAPNVSSQIASRLRPLGQNTAVEPFVGSTNGNLYAGGYVTPRVAASTVGRLTSDPPRRTLGQGGMRATDLYRSAPAVHGQALPPSTGGAIGVASLPSIPFFR